MSTHGFTTRLVQSARAASATSRTTPIYLTAGFPFDDLDAAAAHFTEGAGYAYTRIQNPTIETVERNLAALEGGSQAILLASGQAATVTALLAIVGAGQHIVCSTHIYEGTRGLLRDSLARFGIAVDFISEIDDPDGWRRASRPETRAWFAESISNATNIVLDTATIAAAARERGIPLVVDNTFATPYLVRPLEQGAEVVVHSASKFLAGQGAVLGGVIVDSGRFDPEASGALFPHLVESPRPGVPSVAERTGGDARIAYAREVIAARFGATPSPISAFLIGQGIETLSLRVERQSANALAVARWLETQPEVARVDYAGLPSHASHPLAQRVFERGYGSVFQFTLNGGAAAAQAFVEAVSVFTHMTHLGDVRSLVLHPASTSHALLSADERAAVGVQPGSLRVSIGIEDVADLIDDLRRALDASAAAASVEADLPGAVEAPASISPASVEPAVVVA